MQQFQADVAQKCESFAVVLATEHHSESGDAEAIKLMALFRSKFVRSISFQ